MRPVSRALVLSGALPLLSAACAGGNAASRLAQPPRFEPKDETRCSVVASQSHPLIVEWPSADRLTLENKIREGLVVVRYLGCEMQVLERCSVPARYKYLGATRSEDRVVIDDDDALYADLPVGAAKLEGTLERAGRLTVDMDLVGRYESEKAVVRADELQGDCRGATHFVYGVAVGAFDFYAGADAAVGGGVGIGGIGAAGRSQAGRETLTQNGVEAACTKATIADASPPEGCGALVRIEVVPLGQPRAVLPACPAGAQWNGSACLARKLVTAVVCPDGSTWNGTACVATSVVTDVQCPAGAWWNGTECLAKVVCPPAMAWVPGGKYGNAQGGFADEPEEFTVQPFCLDDSEVTVDAYAACVRSRRCSAEGVEDALEGSTQALFPNGVNGPSYADQVVKLQAHDPLCNYGGAGRGNHPMNCVTWEQAEGYCRAAGMRLPTEWEWVWAAMGGRGPRAYASADSADSSTPRGCWRSAPADSRRQVAPGTGTCPVGGFPGTLQGIEDLEGNVCEWTSSRHPLGGLVARGASWRYGESAYPVARWDDNAKGIDLDYPARNHYAPTVRRADLGFRCAR